MPTTPLQISMTSKRRHQRDTSTSNVSTGTQSPPLKKFVPSALFSFPNRDQLRQALQSGGKIDLDIRNGEFDLTG